ncbi:MAG: rRNA maturation RNase YbeY [Rubrobacteraceae bacterium]
MTVLDETNYGKLSEERATELCVEAFSSQGVDPTRTGELSVVLVEPEVIRGLNLKFRDIDLATDVLSFEIDGPYGEMVGEVVISPASANPEMGIEELVVHGTLHLCGMDHGDDFEKSEMARVQEAVMEKVRGPESK